MQTTQDSPVLPPFSEEQQNKMEDLIADTRLHIEELQSTITILRQANSNESENIDKEDLRYYIEIIEDKIKIIIHQYNEIENQFQEIIIKKS